MTGHFAYESLGPEDACRALRQVGIELSLDEVTGEIVDRYDKRRCSMGDLQCYTPGDHAVLFEINDVRCGIAICMEERAPELWQEYANCGVALVFHSTSGSLDVTTNKKFAEMSLYLAQQYQVFVSQASRCPSHREHRRRPAPVGAARTAR